MNEKRFIRRLIALFIVGLLFIAYGNYLTKSIRIVSVNGEKVHGEIVVKIGNDFHKYYE